LITNICPLNNSIDVNPSPICNLNITYANQDTMHVYIYDNTTRISDTLSYQISDDVDDAWYKDEMKNSNTYVIINYGYSDSATIAGLRFRNVQIPQGATITNATLNVRVFGPNSVDPDVIIYGHYTDNSPVLEGSTGQDELINRSLTTSYVEWIDQDIDVDFQRSPDISGIIEEIVNRPGWEMGNNITILTEDTQSSNVFSIAGYQAGSVFGAELNISFNIPNIFLIS